MNSILVVIRMTNQILSLRAKMFSPTSLTLHLSRDRRDLTWRLTIKTGPLRLRSRNRQYLVMIHLITSMTARTPKQWRVLLTDRGHSHSCRLRALNLASKSKKIPDREIA